jgi:5'-deoxynucleotidase YfbR-like HD superfamily hydrolase
MAAQLSDVVELLAEMGDLKRVRVAGRVGSLAEQSFRRAWAALAAGSPIEVVAQAEAAAAVAATRLGGIDAGVLQAGGLTGEDTIAVLERGIDAVAGPLDEVTHGWLVKGLRLRLAIPQQPAPPFVDALCAQSRAGATCPGRPRLMLEPPESHGDHCWAVAVYGALLASRFGAAPGLVFLTGLAHHLHNALLPDSGFASEALLGAHLPALMETFVAAQLSSLAEPLRGQVARALDGIATADTPVAQAFHAADVLDRVLQMRYYARAAAFTLDQALEELQLVHAGPTQAFHYEVLSAAGLA